MEEKKGYVIELHATFAFCAGSYKEALEKIFENIDLNETSWVDELVEELTPEEFEEQYGDYDYDDEE